MPAEISCEIADHIAFVRLNRPEKLNALNLPMLRGLVSTAHSLKSDRSLRAVVLSGMGPAFCAGIDLGVLAGGLGAFGASFVPRPGRGKSLRPFRGCGGRRRGKSL